VEAKNGSIKVEGDLVSGDEIWAQSGDVIVEGDLNAKKVVAYGEKGIIVHGKMDVESVFATRVQLMRKVEKGGKEVEELVSVDFRQGESINM